MPLKLNVGLSKKIGQPDYSSLGASVYVELELEQALIFHDLEGFHDKVRQAFVACNQALNDELYRQQPDAASGPDPGRRHGPPRHAPALPGIGPGKPRGRTRAATSSQVRAIEAIAHRLDLDLPEILWREYGCQRPEELTIMEASRLIDDLKALPEGVANSNSNGHAHGISQEN